MNIKTLYEEVDKIAKEIKLMAEDDYESGHPFDSNDRDEFIDILDEDGVFDGFKAKLFNLYYDYFRNEY